MRMATAVRTRAPAAGRPSRGAALLRALVAAPAVVGSLLLLLLLSGPLQGWHIVVLLCWPAAGATLLTRPGERLALRLGVGFRRPTAAQAAALNRPMAAALRRTGTAAGDIDLYVQRSPQVNAYTAGRRSLAVTTGTLEQLLAHRLTDDQMIAVLVHELGHHAGCAPHAGLVTAWLSRALAPGDPRASPDRRWAGGTTAAPPASGRRLHRRRPGRGPGTCPAELGRRRCPRRRRDPRPCSAQWRTRPSPATTRCPPTATPPTTASPCPSPPRWAPSTTATRPSAAGHACSPRTPRSTGASTHSWLPPTEPLSKRCKPTQRQPPRRLTATATATRSARARTRVDGNEPSHPS